jgi:hypothetical protein
VQGGAVNEPVHAVGCNRSDALRPVDEVGAGADAKVGDRKLAF